MAIPSNQSFDPVPPLSLEFVYADESNCVVQLEYNQREPDLDLQLQILMTYKDGTKITESEYFTERSGGKFTHDHPKGLKEIRYTLMGLEGDMMKIVTRTVEF
jgi:hypothetical protein